MTALSLAAATLVLAHTVQEVPALISHSETPEGWTIVLAFGQDEAPAVAVGGWDLGGSDVYAELVAWSVAGLPPAPGSYAEGVKLCAQAGREACLQSDGSNGLCWSIYTHPSATCPVATCSYQCRDKHGDCPPMPVGPGVPVPVPSGS